jgi:hypothetical protein
MASGTDGEILTYDASGNPVAVSVGTDGQVLTSTGAGSPPAFEAAGGGNDPYFMVYCSTAQSIAHATATVVQLDSELFDPDNTFNTSTYRFTVPAGKAGKYVFQYGGKVEGLSSAYYCQFYPKVNSSYSNSTTAPGHTGFYGNSSTQTDAQYASKMFDLSVGDYVELIVAVGSGGPNRNISTSYKTFMAAFRIGA